MGNLFAISCLITAFFSFLLGFFILTRKAHFKLNSNWSIVSFLTGIWSFGLWGVVRANSYFEAYIFESILNVGAVFIPVFYLKFVLAFLNLEEKRKKTLNLFYFLATALALFSFSSFYREGMINPNNGFNFWVNPGPFYFLLPLFYTILISYSFYLLISNYKKLKGLTKFQARYVLVTGVIGFAGGSTNFLPQTVGIYPVGNYFVAAYVGVVAYAIVRYRLMGIKVIASRMFTYLIISSFFFISFHVVAFIKDYFLGGIYNTNSLIAGIFMAVAFSLIFLPLLNYIQKTSDALFFKGENPRTVIKNLALRFNSVIELRQLVRIIDEEFGKILSTEEVSVIFSDRKEVNEKVSVWIARNGKMKMHKIEFDNVLYRTILKTKKTLVTEELEGNPSKNEDLLATLNEYDAKVVTPLIARKKVIGIILLGEKRDQGAYTQEDIEFLEIISSQAAIAIENAKLYKEVNDFNDKLQKEVKRATNDLEESNYELKDINSKLGDAYSRLRRLDEAKSEFLSIASHQLRTPLTSIRGFVSMLLEGSYGKVPEEINEILKKVEISNDRLVNLVNQLLNVSRIESGKIDYAFEKNDPEKLTRETVETFRKSAEEKEIRLVYKSPKTKIPELYFDRNILREIISNIIDNAIKYSKKGKIEIAVKQVKKKVRIEVEDQGMGIDKEEVGYIFEKFQRGPGADKVHTEGVGIGLFICKKMIDAHRGKIWAESKGLNKGSKFIVELNVNFKPPKKRKDQNFKSLERFKS